MFAAKERHSGWNQRIWTYLTTITLGTGSDRLRFDSKRRRRGRGQWSDPRYGGGIDGRARCCVINTHICHGRRRRHSYVLLPSLRPGARSFSGFSVRINQGLNYRQKGGTRNWVRIGLALHNFTLDFAEQRLQRFIPTVELNNMRIMQAAKRNQITCCGSTLSTQLAASSASISMLRSLPIAAVSCFTGFMKGKDPERATCEIKTWLL